MYGLRLAALVLISNFSLIKEGREEFWKYACQSKLVDEIEQLSLKEADKYMRTEIK